MNLRKTALSMAAVNVLFFVTLSAHAVGAIAVDDEQGETEPGYGLVTGYDTADQAKTAAVKECREAGNTNCKAVMWFKTCGAYAASRTYYGIGYGDSLQLAEAKAISECGNSSCKVVVSDCE